MVAIPSFTIKELVEAGVHYGHTASRWNPKMAPYLYGERDGVHIIDLNKSAPLLHNALKTVFDIIKNNGRILFVGTKIQASAPIAESAKRCGQYYVNHRWLGGMLTNWNTVSKSIKKMVEMEERLEKAEQGLLKNLTKKEILDLTRKYEKLEKSIGGIREMGGKPDALIVIDTNKEDIAIKEAKLLNIPVIAIVDSNSDPDEIDHPIPGNDDATRSIKLYCKLFADSILAGIQEAMIAAGIDVGSIEEAELIESYAEAKTKKAGETRKRSNVKKFSSNKITTKALADVENKKTDGKEKKEFADTIESGSDKKGKDLKSKKPATKPHAKKPAKENKE